MPQATTTRNGFDVAAQSGSDIAWTGISNLPYPTEGEAQAALTASVQDANTLALKIPQEAAGITTGSFFEEMTLYITVKKNGTYSAATNLSWDGKLNFSTATVWAFSQTIDETYQSLVISGDKTYWKLGLGETTIIDYLKTGALYFKFDVSSTSAVPVNALIKAATVTITYTTVEGKRGAITATLL